MKLHSIIVLSLCVLGPAAASEPPAAPTAPTAPAAAAIEECQFEATSLPGMLVNGASLQSLTLSTGCTNLSLAPDTSVLLSHVDGSEKLHGRVKAFKPSYTAELKTTLVLTLGPVKLDPEKLTQRGWELSADGRKLGQAYIPAYDLKRGGLSISYDDPVLEQKHSGTAHLDKGVPIAVVDRNIKSAHPHTFNSALIEFTPRFDPGDAYWAIERTTWQRHISFEDCKPRQEDNAFPCDLARADVLNFQVDTRLSFPLEIDLALHSRGEEGGELLRVPIVLAAQARTESLPLPLATSLEVHCGQKYASTSKIRAKDALAEQAEQRAASALDKILLEVEPAQSEGGSEKPKPLAENEGFLRQAVQQAQERVERALERKNAADEKYAKAYYAYEKAYTDLNSLAYHAQEAEKLGPGPDRRAAVTRLTEAMPLVREAYDNARYESHQARQEAAEAQRHWQLAQEWADRTGEALQLLQAASKARSEADELARSSNISEKDLELVGDRVVRNGSVHAIDDAALKNGECILALDQTSQLVTDAAQAAIHLPQALEITVLREGENAGVRTVWYIDSPRSEQILPSPSQEGSPSQAYVVQVRIAEESIAELYRQGSVTKANDEKRTNNSFEARLRPAGAYSFYPKPVRLFVTIPLNFTAIRFPANVRDLRSSSEQGHAQFTTLQTGLLLAMEPWDYDRSRALYPVPFRAMAGLHLFDLSKARVSPSILLGASITAPILDAPQVGTSIALGAFWEVDLRDAQAVKDSRLLVTLGLNILSLFGAK